MAPPLRYSNTPCGVTLEHARNLENQCDAAVTGNGGARHARGSLEHFAQWLDDYFFLTHQLIDDEAGAWVRAGIGAGAGRAGALLP